jgi:uncharacterized protein (DUF3084 family)
MSEDPTKRFPEKPTFEERVLDELKTIRTEVGFVRVTQQTILEEQAAIRQEQAAIRQEQVAIRQEQVAIRQEQAAMNSRLTTLEDRVDARLRETRPIWEAVLSELETLKAQMQSLQHQMKKLDEKFNNVIRDLYDVRGEVGLQEKRLAEIERRLNIVTD